MKLNFTTVILNIKVKLLLSIFIELFYIYRTLNILMTSFLNASLEIFIL